MKNNAKIVVDVDGILLNWTNSFLDWVSQYGWSVCERSLRNTYDMSVWLKHETSTEVMSTEQFIAYVKEFNDTPRVITTIGHSVEYVNRLKEAGNTLVALTSFGGTEASRKFRRGYLDFVYGGSFDDIIILGLAESKKDALKTLQPDYLIDDCDTYLEEGLSLGITCIALSTSYNGNTGATYVDSWEEIEELIQLENNNGQ